MTAQKLALRLLRYIGVTQFTALGAGAELDSYSPSDGEDVAAAINGAMQEIFAGGPRHLSHASLSVTLPAPVAVTFTATAGSKTISAANPSSAFVPGALIRVDGETIDNEVVSTTALLHAHGAATGANTGTIYGSAVALPATVAGVTEPVWLDETRRLVPASDYAELQLYESGRSLYYGPEPGLSFVTAPAVGRVSPGTPCAYFADTFYDSAGTTAASKRLRVAPAPAQSFRLRFEARLNPVGITPANFNNDTDPGVNFNLPNGWDEAILLPFALQRWTGSPLFKNAAARDEIARQYKVARQVLAQANPHDSRALSILRGY